jgi:hypothetical protein
MTEKPEMVIGLTPRQHFRAEMFFMNSDLKRDEKPPLDAVPQFQNTLILHLNSQ